MCLDPRGYGVCRILYAAAGIYRGADRHARSRSVVQSHPPRRPGVYPGRVCIAAPQGAGNGRFCQRDPAGAVSGIGLWGKADHRLPQDSVEAFKKCGNVVGLHVYEDLDTAMELPLSLGVVAFTKDKAKAPTQAKALADKILPAAVISVEACGGNAKGVYHNAVGKDVTALEAKSDVLWNELRARGVPNVAIGDLGNEIGWAPLGAH